MTGNVLVKKDLFGTAMMAGTTAARRGRAMVEENRFRLRLFVLRRLLVLILVGEL
jgi:hypothetical protein